MVIQRICYLLVTCHFLVGKFGAEEISISLTSKMFWLTDSVRHSNLDLFSASYTLLLSTKKIYQTILSLRSTRLCLTVIIIKKVLSEGCLLCRLILFLSFHRDSEVKQCSADWFFSYIQSRAVGRVSYWHISPMSGIRTST